MVRGAVVEFPPKNKGDPTVKIILADIGWSRMADALAAAMKSSRPSDPKME